MVPHLGGVTIQMSSSNTSKSWTASTSMVDGTTKSPGTMRASLMRGKKWASLKSGPSSIKLPRAPYYNNRQTEAISFSDGFTS